MNASAARRASMAAPFNATAAAMNRYVELLIARGVPSIRAHEAAAQILGVATQANRRAPRARLVATCEQITLQALARGAGR